MNGLTGVSYGASDLLRLVVARAHDPKCNSFCRARPDSRHSSQLRNQIPERSRIFGLSQNERAGLVGGHLREIQSERF
jgi:hypothetical protein